VPKFPWATRPNSEVIGDHLLHFKPLFDPPLKKVVRKAPSLVKSALVRLGHFLARVNFGSAAPPTGRNMFFRKMRFRWVQFNIEISKVTGPTFTGLVLPNAEKITVQDVTYRFLMFICFKNIRRRTLKSTEIKQNFACF